MYLSEQGIALIKQFEGFSAQPYLCPAGKRTIGYGHVIADAQRFPASGITEAIASAILRQDINTLCDRLKRSLPEGLTQGQVDALLCLAYNIGARALEKSTLLKRLKAGDVAAAAQEFSRWVYAAGVPQPGLVRRREAEKTLFLSV